MSANREAAEKWMRERADDPRVQERMEFNAFDVVDAHLAGQESRQEEIEALREAIRNLASEIDRHDIRAQISTTMIHWFKRLAIDAIAWHAADEEKP